VYLWWVHNNLFCVSHCSDYMPEVQAIIVVVLYSWCFSCYSNPIHWLVHCHMTSNNETVFHQMPWAGNNAKTILWNRKWFDVTHKMLTAVAWHLSIIWLFVFDQFDAFALQYNKSLNEWSLGGTVNFVSLEFQCILRKQKSLFPLGPVISVYYCQI